MKGRTGIAALLASSAWMAAAIVSPASAQQAIDAAARADAYRQVDRALKELDREARMARGGPRNACARFEQLLGSLSESLGPRSVLHRETLTALRSRFATIVNRGCPEGMPRTFRINGETGVIRDSGPPPAPRPLPAPKAAEPSAPALGPAPQQGLTQQDEKRIAEQQGLIEYAEARLDEAQAAWIRGDCEVFWRARESADGTLGVLNPKFFPPDLIERLQSGVRRLFALSCPPPGVAEQPQDQVRADPPPVPGDKPSAPFPEADDLDAIVDDPDASLGPQGLAPDRRQAPPPAAPPAPPRADRSSLIGARAELRAAGKRCDAAAYQAAKDRLLALLDALIADEPDEERSQALIRERDEVRRLIPPTCDPGENILDEIEDGKPPRRPPGLPSLQEEVYLPVEFWLGLGEADTPQTGIGVTHAPPVPETDAGLTNGKVRTVGIGGSFGFPLGTTRARVKANYNWGDGRTAFDVAPISGGFNGAVYGALSESGSSGIGAGSVALTGETRTKVSHFLLGAEVSVIEPTPASRVYVTFNYFRDVRRHGLSLAGTVSTVRFDQHRDQRIRDDAFDLGIGGEVRVSLGGALHAVIGAWGTGSYGSSSLRSREHNTSNFGPDRDFTIATDEEEGGFGVAAGARVTLAYPVSPGVALFAGGGADYRSRVGAVRNPNSGDQLLDDETTGLRTRHMWRYGAQVGMRFDF